MTALELLAPARNLEIGIAAIDCGADAIYIAGPQFGARHAAGNAIGDIRTLCTYAHRFGVRIYVTINTVLFEEELPQAYALMRDVEAAGADALIVQDLALTELSKGFQGGPPVSLPLHASTQCAIRTPAQAVFYERLGFTRLVLERQLSLPQVRAIRSAVSCELEGFVHGALCVGYSGQCYLSACLDGRSANRGACVQACRSRYDLVDGTGKVILRDTALLSLKDLCLLDRLGDLAEAGFCSFKIEGRLKNLSYVRNVVRAYAQALDEVVGRAPERYRRASYGRVAGGFVPDVNRTFNRGYTSLFLDGKRSSWAAMDTPKGVGEAIGRVGSVRPVGRDELEVTVEPLRTDLRLANGDGLAFVRNGALTGFRVDVGNGLVLRCKAVPGLERGVRLYRNLSVDFEKEMERNRCVREIAVTVRLTVGGSAASGYRLLAEAVSEDGRTVRLERDCGTETARDPQRARALLVGQIAKKSGIYAFSCPTVSLETADGNLPFVSAGFVNAVRRELAAALDAGPVRLAAPAETAKPAGRLSPLRSDGDPDTGQARSVAFGRRPKDSDIPSDYRANAANFLARTVLSEAGVAVTGAAYEHEPVPGAEVLRSKYCIRHELGLCPRQAAAQALLGKGSGTSVSGAGPQPRVPVAGNPVGSLYLLNNGRRLTLRFDCAACEMAVLG